MTRRNAHARIQICKFVTKQTERLTCRSSAWDVVRQKAVKSWGPRRSVFSRSHEKRAKRTNVRGFVHARTSRLYRRRQSELSRTRLYGRSLKLLVIPWHRLKRPSPNIIKGGPTSPTIDPVNTATTIPRRITARETRWPTNQLVPSYRVASFKFPSSSTFHTATTKVLKSDQFVIFRRNFRRIVENCAS